ncbi:MAG: curli assembly protein CsgF [Flavobacterium sp.]|jgi:curli production assembly/transport component CsgF
MKIVLFILITSFCYSQDLVYKPKNPALGGDTFNYQWMLSSAESQNKFEDPNQKDRFVQPSELERFKENLNNQLLNHLSRTLFQNQFGDGTTLGTAGAGAQIEEGVFVFGSLSVELYQSNLGLVVNILDIITGEESQIIIPGN